jgi:hypothetical protein
MNKAAALALTLTLTSSVAFAQGGGGGSSGGSTGGAASSSAGPTGAAGSPRAGSAGAGMTVVNGAPPGPANAAGLNNSGNDPSGSGNRPNFSSDTTTGIANPSSESSRASGSRNTQNAGVITTPHNPRVMFLLGMAHCGPIVRCSMPGHNGPTTTSNRDSDARIDAENRELDQTVKGICKGC